MGNQSDENRDTQKQAGVSGRREDSPARGRRTFLKQVATVAAVGSTQRVVGAAPRASERSASARPSSDAVTFPRQFEGAGLQAIAFPLGGVGAGSISLGGRGQLRDWEIFNQPDKGNSPTYAFPSIWVQAEGSKPVARVLEGRARIATAERRRLHR